MWLCVSYEREDKGLRLYGLWAQVNGQSSYTRDVARQALAANHAMIASFGLTLRRLYL
jgi:hypothetical protein